MKKREQRTETTSPYAWAHSVNLGKGLRPCYSWTTIITNRSWTKALGSWRIFPRKGVVGGPGGRCASRLPHLSSFRREKSIRETTITDRFIAISFAAVVRKRAYLQALGSFVYLDPD